MKKYILIAAAVAVTSALALAQTPVFGKFRLSYSGAVVSYVGASGTNTAIEVIYDGDIPFRLADVSATVNGAAAGTATVYRVWQFHRDAYKVVVSTNLFGTVETNSYMQTSEIESITNTVYTSTSDTLPGTAHFISGDKMIVDFNTQTGVVVRILGTAQ
jgi:hypothetical protein